jgi:outer membrane immunogenic protein
MKQLLVGTVGLVALAAAGAANAADFGPAPIWRWTGFYVGGNAGYSWGRSPTDATFSDSQTGATLAIVSNTANLNGGLAGLQTGYNWQIHRLVFGIETDIQWTGEHGGASFPCPTACSPNGPVMATLDPSLRWFGTLRGRLGVTSSHVMAYVTGGLAFGEVKTDGTFSGFNLAGLPMAGTFSGSSTKAGWTMGAGAEAVLDRNWTGKIEYLYMDLGTISVIPPVAGGFSSRVTDNILRVGVSYQFR